MSELDPSSEPQRRSGWHSFDPGSLIAGTFFLALGVTELADQKALPPRVIAPIVLVGLVVVGILLALTRRRRRS